MKYKKGEKSLPVDALTDREVQDFMDKYLSKERLGLHELQKIYRLFGLDDSKIARIYCDKSHGHGLDCQEYSNLPSAVIDRLIEEIRKQRSVLRDLETKISGS